MNTTEFPTIAEKATKMTNKQLLKTFESLKSNHVFYSQILKEEYRLKNPESYRYREAQKHLNHLNAAGPKIHALIQSKGLKASHLFSFSIFNKKLNKQLLCVRKKLRIIPI